MDPQTEQTIPNCDGAAVVERHDMYFFEFVVFQVQTTLFSVPKNGFLDSNPAFFEKYAHSKTTDAPSEAYPIELKDVTPESFKGLLLVLYPFKRTAETYEEWLGALDLATRWDLVDVRRKAIDNLSKMNERGEHSTVEILLLAKKYCIKEWLLEAYVNLVQNEDLNLNVLRQQEPDHDSLDWETMARLFSVRLELTQWAGSRPVCSTCSKGKAICAKNCSNKSRKDATLKQARDQVYIAFADEVASMPNTVEMDPTVTIPPSDATDTVTAGPPGLKPSNKTKDTDKTFGGGTPLLTSPPSFDFSAWEDPDPSPEPTPISATTSTTTSAKKHCTKPAWSKPQQSFGESYEPKPHPNWSMLISSFLNEEEKNKRNAAPAWGFGKPNNV